MYIKQKWELEQITDEEIGEIINNGKRQLYRESLGGKTSSLS